MKYVSSSSEETAKIGFTLGKYLKSGDTVLLYGDLGSGKSVFARGCAAALGVKGSMASPTFTLMQPYEGTETKVYHFDLYRLSDADELYYAGLDEHIGGDGVALIEWPQQADVCPKKRVEIDFERGEDPDKRNIELELIGMDDRKDAILRAMSVFAAEM